ncbi:MAG: hypothetical protein H6704_06590 [Myxococcales bacterium]|nr:hypothetical protein [Myxococcales bacterium]
MLRALGVAGLLATVPLMLLALRALAGRDYVGGALVVFAAAAVGHLGLELVALDAEPAPAPPTDDEDDDEEVPR